MKNKLTAVVLAGGSGSRFWPFQTDKNLFPFFSKPLFEYTVIQNIPQEVTDIVIITNTNNYNTIESLHYPVRHKTFIQPEAKGMADALLIAESEIVDSSILIIIADHLVDRSLFKSIINKAQLSNAFCVLPGWKTSAYFPGGYLKIDGEKIVEIIEKPKPDAIPSPYVYISGQYIEDANILLNELKTTQSKTDDIFEKTLSKLANHYPFIMEPYNGISSSLKYPWNVLDIMNDLFILDFKAYRGVNTKISNNVQIEGPVYIGDNVKIFEHTKITGPVYIGNNTIIGNNNIIRASHIGNNCVTGFNTDITRSYIGDSCWFHTNYIGDSIFESDISLGSGTVCANLRLDEDQIQSQIKEKKVITGRNKLGSLIAKNVRIGVNTSLMPGVKIGSGTYIGAGICIDQDIPTNRFVYGKTIIENRENKKTILPMKRDEFKLKI